MCLIAGDSKAPYNWLTQSSMDTFSDFNVTLPATGEESALLFTIGRKPAKPGLKGLKPAGPGFGRDRLKGKDAVDGKQGG